MHATDDDGDNVEFFIVDGSHSEYFDINSKSGEVFLIRLLTSIPISTLINLKIQASDDGFPSRFSDMEIVFEITDVNSNRLGSNEVCMQHHLRGIQKNKSRRKNRAS